MEGLANIYYILIYLSSFVLALVLVAFILQSLDIKKFKKPLNVYLISVFVSSSLLKLPYYIKENGFVIAIYKSISYTIEGFVFKDEFLVERLDFFWRNFPYFQANLASAATQILMFLAPALTLTILILFIRNSLNKFILRSNKKKNYIFNEINERTLSLAKELISIKSIKENKVFFVANNANKDELDLVEKIGARSLKMNIEDLSFLGNNSDDIVILAAKDDKNIEDAVLLSQLNKINNAVKVYVLLGSRDVKLLFLNLELYNEKINFHSIIVGDVLLNTYLFLFRQPLSKYAKDSSLNVAILGESEYAREFLKAATWCGQLSGVDLKLSLACKNPDEIIEKLKEECPYLIKEKIKDEQGNYHLQGFYVKINIYSTDYSERSLDKVYSEYFVDSNYAFIAGENYSENTLRAVKLNDAFAKSKESYLINYLSKQGLISDTICDKYKGKLNIVDANSGDYAFNAILDNSLETMAETVHLSWYGDIEGDELKKAIYSLYNSEYNFVSSLASAIHSNYKIDLIAKRTGSINAIYNLDKKSELYMDLLRLEHNRWSLFMISRGYSLLEINDYNRYLKSNKKANKDDVNKLHSCIVKWDENLEIVLKESDFDVFIEDKEVYYKKLKNHEIDELDMVGLELYSYHKAVCGDAQAKKKDYKTVDAQMIDILPKLYDLMNK